MDARRLWFIPDVIGSNRVQFQIPVYQRNYDWSVENCKKLMSDIKDIVETGEKHFLGTIVYMSDKKTSASFQKYIIIDGQQRLTTIMLILKALHDIALTINDKSAEQIDNEFLHNKYCDEEFKIKLKPIKTDNEQFTMLLKNDENVNKDSNIYRNYEFCKKYLEKLINENSLTPNQILEALFSLEIVEIVLEQGKDDPQIIFESINSTGLELTQADLIRNFLLMNADNQEYLYLEYWQKIEEMLRVNNDYSEVNNFFTTFLTYKTNNIVNEKKLYNAFVKFFKNYGKSQEEILSELKMNARIFSAFIGNKIYSKSIQEILKSYDYIDQKTLFPFLLHIFNDFEKRIIEESTLIKVLEFLLSYLLHRLVCEIDSKALRGLFATLYNRVFKVQKNKDKYCNTIIKFFQTIHSKDKIPTFKEFQTSLSKINIYRKTKLCKFILMDIENSSSKEKMLDADNISIEHIMPQALTKEWENELGNIDKYEEYLHKLGNLTVTGYNSTLSNKSFQEKIKTLKLSKAIFLNKDVISEKHWTFDKIETRGKRLAEFFAKKYKVDTVKDEDIAFNNLDFVTLKYDNIKKKTLDCFRFQNTTHYADNFTTLFLDLLKILDEIDPNKLTNLAENQHSYVPDTTKNKHVYISNQEDENMRNPIKFKENVWVEKSIPLDRICKITESVLNEFGFNIEDLQIGLVKK
ncbi:DUF262 domain-containing HNH endonuclease family protein [Campylobacter coli]|nr:DUF262 domain-containing protein [Campylobacter coli]